MTRDQDVFVSLGERVRVARAAKADLFISIHADSISGGAGGAGADGLYRLGAGLRRRIRPASPTARTRPTPSPALESGDMPDEVADILQELTLRETRGFSHGFAKPPRRRARSGERAEQEAAPAGGLQGAARPRRAVGAASSSAICRASAGSRPAHLRRLARPASTAAMATADRPVLRRRGSQTSGPANRRRPSFTIDAVSKERVGNDGGGAIPPLACGRGIGAGLPASGRHLGGKTGRRRGRHENGDQLRNALRPTILRLPLQRRRDLLPDRRRRRWPTATGNIRRTCRTTRSSPITSRR